MSAPLADDGFDWEALRRFVQDQVPGLTGPLEISRFTGGYSNLTFLVSIGSVALVVKRPPNGPRPKGAHDMGREYRMLSGLHERYRWCPRAIAFCGDPELAGAEFLVMERLDGTVIRPDVIAERQLSKTELSAQLLRLIEALASLHAVDPDVALPGFGKPEGYRERQRDGWIARFEAAATDDVPAFDDIVAWLMANTPTSPVRAAPIHNDFKLDNLIWTGDRLTELQGVLDWEMATVGDPLMDLSCTLSFWVQANDPPAFRALRAMPSAFAGAPTRADAITAYSTATGQTIDRADFYLCFGLFRRAVIEQQKYARYRRGHSTDERYAGLDQAVRVIGDMCRRVIDGDLG